MNLRQSLRKTTTVLILAWLVLHLAGLPGALAGALTDALPGQMDGPAINHASSPAIGQMSGQSGGSAQDRTVGWIQAQTNARPSVTLLAANTGITIQKPQVRVTEEADLPKAAAEEEGWFSRYKWWPLAGLVVIAGGAAAAGGGGGSDSSGGGSTSGGVDVTW